MRGKEIDLRFGYDCAELSKFMMTNMDCDSHYLFSRISSPMFRDGLHVAPAFTDNNGEVYYTDTFFLQNNPVSFSELKKNGKLVTGSSKHVSDDVITYRLDSKNKMKVSKNLISTVTGKYSKVEYVYDLTKKIISKDEIPYPIYDSKTTRKCALFRLYDFENDNYISIMYTGPNVSASVIDKDGNVISSDKKGFYFDRVSEITNGEFTQSGFFEYYKDTFQP